MKVLNKPTLIIAFILVSIFTWKATPAYSKDVNSIIIATVDNVKGLVDLTTIQSICNSIAYEDFKYIGLSEDLSMFNKDCVCQEYKRFKQESITHSSELFMKAIRDCRLDIKIESIENAIKVEVVKESGGYTVPQNEVNEGSDGISQEEKEDIPDETKIVRNDINIFPNPAKSLITLSYTNVGNATHLSFQIFDATGKEVEINIPELKTETGSHEIQINLSHLQTGLYFYTFLREGKQISGRLYKIN